MIDGVLIIDKEAGPTSHDVVDGVRKILKTRKALCSDESTDVFRKAPSVLKQLRHNI